MRENYRNSIASVNKFPQFTIMNVIEGQAGLVIYSSLIFYSLTIDNILNIIVLLILAGISIMMLTGQNGILNRAGEAKETTGTAQTEEQITLAVNGAITRGLGTVGYYDLITELDGQFGAGKYSIDPESDTATSWTVTVNGKSYKIKSTGATKISKPLPKVEGVTMPYLPSEDYEQVEGTDLNTGLVVEDGSGNQYVWIEVPKTAEVYQNATVNLDFSTLSGDALTNAYTAIEDDLHDYTMLYRTRGVGTETSYKDIYYSDATTGLTETQYNNLKKTMLKSVYENGGFWIGRYEAGIGTNRPSNTSISDDLKPTSKENEYPLTYVKCSQAQTLASRVAPEGRTSSLMFGVQWDLVLKYIEEKTVEKAEEANKSTTRTTIQTAINSDSKTWGNYYNATFALNRGEYAKKGATSGTWNTYTTALENCVGVKNGVYTKLAASSNANAILLTTGASNDTSKQNIYDIAGNVWEYTLEYASDTNLPCALRGGYFGTDGELSASFRVDSITNRSDYDFRFPCFTLLGCLKKPIYKF